MVKIKDLPKFTRPREKLFEKGPEALKDSELLAILLRTGYKGKSAIEVAKRLLESLTFEQLQNVSPRDLAKIKGVGCSRASTISAGLEFSKRVFKVEKDITITTPEDVFKVTSFLADKKKEYLVVLYLDARNRLIKKLTISVGTLTASIIHPREVFAPAIQNRAAQLIIVHNHPSGNDKPSEDDLKVTKKLISSGELLGIEIIDHLIITNTTHFSFKENNIL